MYERLYPFILYSSHKQQKNNRLQAKYRNVQSLENFVFMKGEFEIDIKNRQDEQDLRQLVNNLIECNEYKEAYRTCIQYIKEGRCKSAAQELSKELIPLMKKQNQQQNRKQIIIVTLVTIVIMILSILL